MSSKANPSGKEKTYEQIGKIQNISPQQVHKKEKDAINKIIRRTIELKNYDIIQSITYFCTMFGVEPEQCLKKLDFANKELLSVYMKENY